MERGTFANIRIRNEMMGARREGGNTIYYPPKEAMSIFDAAQYKKEGVPLVIFGGKEYGTGSSRDWAAKGPKLLGVRAVITQLRAHPPLQPDRHGRRALRLRGGNVVADAGLEGRRDGGDRRPRTYTPAPENAGRHHLMATARKRMCRWSAASIRSTNSTTSGMAASCNTCCATSLPDAAKSERPDRPSCVGRPFRPAGLDRERTSRRRRLPPEGLANQKT